MGGKRLMYLNKLSAYGALLGVLSKKRNTTMRNTTMRNTTTSAELGSGKAITFLEWNSTKTSLRSNDSCFGFTQTK
jgi:hypothetical protein